MKLRKTLLLSLVSLSLVGCTNSKTPSTPETNEKEEDKNIDNGGKDQEGEGNTKDDGKDPTPTPTPDPDPYPEEKTDEDLWHQELVTLMKKYLGGQVITYIDLGKYDTLTTNYVVDADIGGSNYLSIQTLKAYDVITVSNIIVDYQDAEWTVKSKDNGFSATKGTLEVVLLEEDGMISLHIIYDEPYDKTSVSSWSDDMKNLFATYLDKHEIPFVYLGTATPAYLSWDYGQSETYVYGGKYTDDTVDDAIKVFQADKDWTLYTGTDFEGKVLQAIKVMDDDCTITVSIACQDKSNPRTYMIVSIKEGFDPTKYTAWDSHCLDAFKNNLEGHELPVLYAGASTPEREWDANRSTLTITGGYWNDKFLSNAESVLKADLDDGQNPIWKDITYGTNSYGTTLTATRVDYDDGCGIKLVLGGTSTDVNTNRNSIAIIYAPKIDIPTDVSDWSDSVKDAMNTKISTYSDLTILDGHEIPYVYLNKYDETGSAYTYDVRYLQVIGGKYNPNIIKNAIDVYAKAGWDAKSVKGNYGYDGFVATKKFNHTSTDEEGNNVEDSSHPCEITVRILPPETEACYNSDIILYAYLKEDFDSSKTGSWNESIQNDLTSYFNGVGVPYIYMGSDAVVKRYTKSTLTETIYGGTWDDSLWESVKTAFTAAKWTVTEPDLISDKPELVATYEDGEAGVVTAKFSKHITSKSPYSVPMLTLQYASNYKEPADGAWGTDTLSKFKTTFGTDVDTNTNVIPYIYLHIENGKEICKLDTSKNAYQIQGGVWDTRILADAKAKFIAAGWETSMSSSSYSGLLVAHTTFEDGTLVTAKIYKSGSSTTAKAYMYVYYDVKATLDTSKTDWTETQKTNMKSVLEGNTIPYFDLGTATQTETTFIPNETNKGKYSWNLVGSKATDWTDNYTLNAESVLKNEGWTTSLEFNDSNLYNSTYPDNGPRLVAYKEVSNGVLNINLWSKSTKDYCLNVWLDEAYSNSSEYSYKAKDKEDLKNVFGFEIPTIYLGAYGYSSSISKPGRYATITSYSSVANYIENAKKVFEEDEEHEWKLSDMSSGWLMSNGIYAKDNQMLVAETKNDDGETVSVYVYEVFKRAVTTTTNPTHTAMLKIAVD